MIFNQKQKKIKNLAEKFKLEQVILFGSQTTGQTTPTSDFDIGVLASRPLPSKDYDRLLIELSQKLNLPIQKIDLTILNRAAPLLLFQAASQGKLLYGRQSDFDRFRLYAIKRYQDHQKFFKLLDNYLEKKYA